MIIYQVNITVDAAVEEEWLKWMKEVHVADLIKTGLVSSYQIWKDSQERSRDYTFNYYFLTEEDLAQYQSDHAPALKQDVIDRYDGQFSSSRKVYRQL